jgi:O-antigen/teichoic acid export membrane protein
LTSEGQGPTEDLDPRSSMAGTAAGPGAEPRAAAGGGAEPRQAAGPGAEARAADEAAVESPGGPPDRPDPVGQVRGLAKQSLLLVSTGGVSYVGTFVLTVILARILGKHDFGEWAIGYSIATLLSTVGLAGADWILLRQGSYYDGVGDVARLRRTIHLALAISGAFLCVLGGALFVTAGYFATHVFSTPSIEPILRLTGVLTPIMGLRQVLVFATQASKSMKDAAVNRNLLQPFARLLLVGVALALVRSSFSAYVGLFAAEVFLAVAAAWILNRRAPLLGPTAPIDGRKLLAFAIPAWASRLLGQTRGQVVPILVGSLAAVSGSAVFVASRRIAVAPTSALDAMNQVYTAMGSNLYLQNRREELAALFKSTAKWSYMIGLPLFCLMVAFPGEVLSLFGSGFRSGSTALVVLAAGMLFQFATGPVTVSLIIAGRPRLAVFDYALVVAVEIGLAVWLIPSSGVLGAAIAKAVGTMLNNVLPLIQVWLILRVHPFRVDFWKPAAAAAVAVGAAKAVVVALGVGGVAAAAIAGAVLGIVYVGVVVALGLDQDRVLLDVILRRKMADEGTGSPPEAPGEVDPRGEIDPQGGMDPQ